MQPLYILKHVLKILTHVPVIERLEYICILPSGLAVVFLQRHKSLYTPREISKQAGIILIGEFLFRIQLFANDISGQRFFIPSDIRRYEVKQPEIGFILIVQRRKEVLSEPLELIDRESAKKLKKLSVGQSQDFF